MGEEDAQLADYLCMPAAIRMAVRSGQLACPWSTEALSLGGMLLAQHKVFLEGPQGTFRE